MRGMRFPLVVAAALALAAVSRGAIVGTPVIGSTFDVRIRQGATDIVNGTFVVPADFRPDGYKAITLASLDATNDIVLKVHVETPNDAQSIIHYYIRTVDPTLPVSPNPAHQADPFGHPIEPIEYWWNVGSRPVYDLAGTGKLSVEITGLDFSGGSVLQTYIPLADDHFSAMYMFNPYGQYFEVPGATLAHVGYAPPRNQPPRLTGQVSAMRFQDHPDPPLDYWDDYFVGALGASTVSVGYYDMNNPPEQAAGGKPYTVYDPFVGGGTGGVPDGYHVDGFVQEMGLAHLVNAIPEPATMAILLLGIPVLGLCRRRRRPRRAR